MSYAPGKVERVNGVAPLSRPWHGRILLLNHTRKNGVPSRTLTSNLEFRTLPLCDLSYGDKRSNHWLGYTRVGAHGRIRTDTVRVLSALSLRWTTWAKWCRVREFHPQPLRSERSVSCRWTNAAKIFNRKS